MNNLGKVLNHKKLNDEKVLVAYLVAGDPDLENSLDLMHLLVEAGVDIIELGVPFTDPIAEGPVIQKAHDRALKKNTDFKSIMNLVNKFRISDPQTPIILMGYINTFVTNKKLINMKDNGIDGVLVVDIPGEFNLADYEINNKNIDSISLISPTTSDDRIKTIVDQSSGFIYYVTLRGVTGSSHFDKSEIEFNIKKIKNLSNMPVMAGFGIKTTEDASVLASYSDGVVIGSSIVDLIDKNSDKKDFESVKKYVTDIKEAISQ